MRLAVILIVLMVSPLASASCDPDCELTVREYASWLESWPDSGSMGCAGTASFSILDLVCASESILRTYEPHAALVSTIDGYHDAAVVGQHVYALGYGDHDELYVWDIPNLLALTTFTEIQPSAGPITITNGIKCTASSNFLYVYGTHLFVYSLASPLVPNLVNTVSSSYGYFKHAVAIADRIYTVGYDGVETFSISTPQSPSNLGQLAFPDTARPRTLTPNGNFIYVATDAGTLRILNQTNPELLTLAADLSFMETTSHLVVREGQLLATNSSRIELYDLTNPLSPNLLDSYTSLTPSFGKCLVLDRESLVCVQEVIQITNSTFDQIGIFSTPGGNNGDGFAYQGAAYPFGLECLIFLPQRNQVTVLRTN